jgi:predicted dehydrogenase
MTASRRDFLRTAAGAAAALSFPLEEVLTDTRPMPPARPRTPLGRYEPVRIGVIGTGGMGTEHCQAFMRLVAAGRADLRIEALCDVCDPRLMNAKQKVVEVQGGDVATYRDYRALLARRDLHGVLIATPEHWHGAMAEDALLAGKDVYLEKPMTYDLKDALRLQAVAAAVPDQRLVVGTQYVMTPSYSAARQLVAEGVIGKPVWSQTSYCRNSKEGEWLYYQIDPAWQPGINLDWKAWCGPLGEVPWNPEIYARWRRYRRYSTGIIGDLLVHRITPLVMAIGLGWPVRVVASGGHYIDKAMENHDQVNLNIEFEDEHTMVVAGSTCNEIGFETLIRGHKGNIYLQGRNAVVRPERIYADEGEERTITGEPGNDHDNLRLAWLDCIRTRGPSPSGIELGVKVMVIVDLAARSLWEQAAFGYVPAEQRVRRL